MKKEKTCRWTFELPPELAAEFDKVCGKIYKKRSEVLRDLVRDFVKNENNNRRR